MTTDSLIKIPDSLPVPKKAVFAPTQSVRQAIYTVFCQAGDSSAREQLFADFAPLCVSESVAIVGPVVGSPAAVLVCEPLLRSGVSELVLIGCAGGLLPANPEMKIGDIVFPRGAVSEEGTSSLYGAENAQQYPASELQEKLEDTIKKHLSAQHRENRFHLGSVWSTDAPYRETIDKVAEFSRMGAIAVEMEFAAIARLCELYDAKLACALVISDLLGENWTPGFRQIKKSRILDLLAASIFDTLK